MTITSHAATDDYRAGWEQIFGGEVDPTIRADECETALVFHVIGGKLIREHYEPIGDEL